MRYFQTYHPNVRSPADPSRIENAEYGMRGPFPEQLPHKLVTWKGVFCVSPSHEVCRDLIMCHLPTWVAESLLIAAPRLILLCLGRSFASLA